MTSTSPGGKKPATQAEKEKDAKERRLAEALRQNLLRRKAAKPPKGKDA